MVWYNKIKNIAAISAALLLGYIAYPMTNSTKAAESMPRQNSSSLAGLLTPALSSSSILPNYAFDKFGAYRMNKEGLEYFGILPPSLDSPTLYPTMMGAGDFNGDGKSDLVWLVSSGRQPYVIFLESKMESPASESNK
jgi:hypothetical protein